MIRARDAILASGGAERSNVFTRAQLALFGQVPWRAVPVMPLEIMHLPLWFPFHLSKMSYWSRTVIVPLLVLMALRPRARNPRGIEIRELFRTPPEQVRDYIRGPYRSAWGRFFKGLDSALRVATPFFPARSRRSAIDKAVAFVTERLNGEDGLGGIYPAIANSVMMFDTLGFDPAAPPAATAWQAVRKLLVIEEDRAYCQPCLSPVWDTGLAGHAMAEAGHPNAVDAACDWLRARQINEVVGDWAVRRPGLPPGGWAFQYLERPLPRRGRHRRGRHAAASARRSGIRGGAGARAGLGHRDAIKRRRLGGVRAGEHASPPQPHPVRRSRRAARSTDGRRHCALRLLPGADRDAPRRSGAGPCPRLPAARPVRGRELVRPLGHQLHLRHVVGALRAQRAGPALRGRCCAPGSRFPALGAARGRRLGRGRGELRRGAAWALPREHGRARPPGRCSA